MHTNRISQGLPVYQGVGVGRLFWKFFFFFWLAQFATSIGVGVMIWLKSHDAEHIAGCAPSSFFDFPPPPPHSGKDDIHRPPPPPPYSGAEHYWPPSPPHSGAELHRPPHEHLPFPPLMPLLAGAVVSLVFAALLAWYFSKPIRSLRAAFEAATNGRLDEPVEPKMGKRRDELADLGRDFDRMAQRLKSLMDGQRRLLHDVSHELRSPLARLQAAIGLARQQPERLDDTLARIERESVRMDKLVSELLTLSRLEAGMAGKLDEDVSMSELLTDVVDDARFEAETSGCRVEFEAHGEATLQGNAELLHRAVENVVRNALKHSPAGGLVSIAVRVNANDRSVSISVSDEGAGVPESELHAIFEPFFRGNQANAPDGHGLGLAISQRVIMAHHGSISAGNRTTGGLCVTLSLPVK